uniref:Very-long-chain 3-oxoacyl-CoA reductase n=1 Tax=Talaromyces marneffei PM1 TaxID=1077442 RepID=A0A093VIS5_TALMA
MKVYSHLVPLQGKNIPVCLGSIALTRPYPLVSMAKVTKMLLMSWAGTSLCYNTWPEGVDIKKETDKTLQTLAQSGVRHDDIRQSNLVWNAERQRVMAIDLQQATIIFVAKRKSSPAVLDVHKRRKLLAGPSHIKAIVI